MERIKDRLGDKSDRIEKIGYIGSNEDPQSLYGLMDEIGLRTATTDCQVSSEAQASSFGRGEVIERIIGFAENLTPIALIGPSGIGKTSAALTVLHHHRVKQRLGENPRFIRCDQFPATSTHLLSRPSKVTSADVETPRDFTPLHPFPSSREILVVLDNAESILDPRGTDAAKICGLVEELSRSETMSLYYVSDLYHSS